MWPRPSAPVGHCPHRVAAHRAPADEGDRKHCRGSAAAHVRPPPIKASASAFLTPLVSAYTLLAKPERLAGERQRAAAVKRLNDLRREFVSEAQLSIDPRRYMAMKEPNAIRISHGLAPQTKHDGDPAEADQWQHDREPAEAFK